uniref:Uncharacterized protein n=1 Tax=Sphaerodactylus townsendi TaxID=933632 RepID=A0ACB8FS88_9SAUR
MALPCDVATLVKQFLRDLPEPLVPAELQGPLCKVQQRPEEDRGALSILLTCLLPGTSAGTLRYFFSFLQDVAARCAQNKMDLSNLAVVFTPNLFPSELCCKLDGEAEERLQTQAAVVKLLIAHALEIGTVPHSLVGKVETAFLDTEHKTSSPPSPGDKGGKEKEGWQRRSRRRSMGDIVTEALSKFKTGRALRAAPCPETKEGACPGVESLNNKTTLRTSFNSKRKASDDAVGNPELSTKKRRSTVESECSDSSKTEEWPVDVGFTPGPASPAFVFSDGTLNPVSEIKRCSGSPRIRTRKVQRRKSSCRKHPQRKHSVRTATCHSPTRFEHKDAGRKPLRVFSRSSKDPCPLSPSIKATEEANGWFLAKKMVTDVPDSPNSQQPWTHLPSHKPKDTKEASLSPSSHEDSPWAAEAARDTAEKCKTHIGSSPSLDGVSCRPQEPALNGGSLVKGEGLLGAPTEAALLPDERRVLRRSLSWPEELFARGAAKRGETDSSPDEAAICPGNCFSPADPGHPDADVVVATGARQVSIPVVCVTPADSYGAACSEDKPLDIPDTLPSSQLVLPEDHSTRDDGVHCFSKAPQSSLKRFALGFQRLLSQPNEGPDVARPKRKGGRRFGRSISHESGLPLGAGEKTGCVVKTSPPPKSPLQAFKTYGRQIFIAHKSWAVAFAGLRAKKESASQRPQETERLETHS